MYQWIDTLLELYIAIILTVEYLWGRSDTDIKKEEKRKQAKKEPKIDPPLIGEHK